MSEFIGMNESNVKKLLHLTAIVSVLSMTLFAVFHTNVRTKIQNKLIKKDRKVLSVVTGDLFNNGTSVKVVKIQEYNRLILEIYGPPRHGARKLLFNLSIPDPYDGFFHFRGQATNLALEDIDNDRTIEIIAPSFDKSLVAHLNIFKYNAISQQFEPYDPTKEPLTN